MEKLNKISYDIIGCAYKVHSELGPGLLESIYQACLIRELSESGMKCEMQKPLPVVYKDIKLDAGYRIDILVENDVLVELKSVDFISPVHVAQLLTYMKLSGKRLGILINFNVINLKEGIRRLIL
jgi:GxxExxY protein